MSNSQHPIALRLERLVGGDTRLLATVMCLPLIDGIFPALVLADALSTPLGVLQVGLLVFGGSATVAVVLADMDSKPRDQLSSVLAVGVVLVAVAALEAAMAPTIESALNIAIFERFAAVVLVAVAAKTASARIGEYLPSPAVVIGLGMVASLELSAVQLSFGLDVGLVVRAAAAALVGVAFAVSVILLQPYLVEVLDLDSFRFGSSVALGVLAVSIFSKTFSAAPLAVLVVAAFLAFDPSGANDERAAPQTDGCGEDDGRDQDPEAAYGYPNERGAEERAPWL